MITRGNLIKGKQVGPPMYQCPYNIAILCAMTDGCAGCEDFNEGKGTMDVPYRSLNDK